MYSFKPIPLEKRPTWEFPAWPHTDDEEEYELFENFLKENSIFFYQDPLPMGKEGKFLPEIMLKLDKTDFVGYKHMLNVDPDTLHVMPWPKNAQNRRNPKMSHIHRTIDVHGDTAAWESFNIPGEIETDYDSRMLKFTELSDYVETTQELKCTTKNATANYRV